MVFQNNVKNKAISPLKIAIHDLKKTVITGKNKIIYCKAEGSYTRIYLLNHSLIVTKSLKYVDSILPKDTFIRIHKSYLININYITGFKHKNILMRWSNSTGQFIYQI